MTHIRGSSHQPRHNKTIPSYICCVCLFQGQPDECKYVTGFWSCKNPFLKNNLFVSFDNFHQNLKYCIRYFVCVFTYSILRENMEADLLTRLQSVRIDELKIRFATTSKMLKAGWQCFSCFLIYLDFLDQLG